MGHALTVLQLVRASCCVGVGSTHTHFHPSPSNPPETRLCVRVCLIKCLCPVGRVRARLRQNVSRTGETIYVPIEPGATVRFSCAYYTTAGQASRCCSVTTKQEHRDGTCTCTKKHI